MGHVRPICCLQASHLITTVIRHCACGINACQACPERNPDSHMFAWCLQRKYYAIDNLSVLLRKTTLFDQLQDGS